MMNAPLVSIIDEICTSEPLEIGELVLRWKRDLGANQSWPSNMMEIHALLSCTGDAARAGVWMLGLSLSYVAQDISVPRSGGVWEFHGSGHLLCGARHSSAIPWTGAGRHNGQCMGDSPFEGVSLKLMRTARSGNVHRGIGCADTCGVGEMRGGGYILNEKAIILASMVCAAPVRRDGVWESGC